MVAEEVEAAAAALLLLLEYQQEEEPSAERPLTEPAAAAGWERVLWQPIYS